MSDMADVVTAIHEADAARASLKACGDQLDDDAATDVALALVFAAEAICAQLAALTTRLDYLAHVFGEKRHGG